MNSCMKYPHNGGLLALYLFSQAPPFDCAQDEASNRQADAPALGPSSLGLSPGSLSPRIKETKGLLGKTRRAATSRNLVSFVKNLRPQEIQSRIIRGSIASRSASPTKLIAIMVSVMHDPGASQRQGRVVKLVKV